MDWWSLVASIPGVGPYLPYLAALGICCAAIATVMPPPKSTTGVYAAVYKTVNFLGLNFGHARNATAPTTK